MNDNEIITSLHGIAVAVAEHLPPGWRYVDEGSTGNGLSRSPTIAGPGELAFYMRMMNKRLHVGGVYPAPVCVDGHNITGQFIPSEEDRPHITCDPKREPSKIAADIARRFLTAYEGSFAVQMEEKRKTIDRLASERAALSELLDACGGEQRSEKVDLRYDSPHSPHGHFEVRGFYDGDPAVVNMKIDGVPLETALWIAAELADCKQRVERRET